MKSIVKGVRVLVLLVVPAVAAAAGGEPTPAEKDLQSRKGSRAADAVEGKPPAKEVQPIPSPTPKLPHPLPPAGSDAGRYGALSSPTILRLVLVVVLSSSVFPLPAPA
jgi:hypothetical protein